MDYRRLNQDEITINPQNVAPLVNWERPITNMDVQSFLGLDGYYHWFVQDFPTITKAEDEANYEGCSICLD